MRKRGKQVAAASIGVFVLAVGLASPAAAAEADAAAPLENCWVDLATNDHLCVPAGEDIVTAVAEEKGVQLVIPGQTSKAAHSTSADGEALLASTVLALLYDNINYGGSTFTLSVAGTVTCGTYTYSNLHQFGWGDRISSYRTYAGCRGTIYENELFVGAQYGPTTSASQLFGMNDKGSSFRAAP